MWVAVFLKSLTLKGFKSFADSTILEMEPGVTVVVGPNGSGKSNVVDAIAWVLGAQAPSSVRSQKMEDVIFNGSQKRAALGRAEVALTLDNSEGLLPLDFTEITVSRTLFRNGDSEYAINGVECRLRDVQDLLSDAGVGRQQHLIVSQGQIDAVLTARAEDRRAIIEEAAGVLKFRKRKESAERRLESTEANLMRVQDLIREVRRQLRPLERQADAARKHDAIQAELRALRLFLAGREVASMRARLTSLAGERTVAETSERELRTRLAALDTEVLAAEAELTARGDSGLSDELMRVDQLRERARGVAALIVERRRSMERDHGQLIAEDVVAAIEADAAQMRVELADVERSLTIAEDESGALAAEETTFESERLEQGLFHTVHGNDASTAAAEVRGELRTLRNAVEQAAGEAQRLQASIESVAARDANLGTAVEALQRELADAENAVGSVRADLRAAHDRRDELEAAVDGAQETVAAAERSFARATARIESLESATATTRARAGAEHLAQVTGVVGALIDAVDIDTGWEEAVAAALGESLAAVVVVDPLTARRALEALRASGNTGAILALGRTRSGTTATPPGTDSVRSRIRVRGDMPAQIGELLDSLVGHIGCAADLAAAVELVESNPALVVVTRAGDRLAPSGWRLGAADDAGSQTVLDSARAAGESARAELEQETASLVVLRADLVDMRRNLVDLQDNLDARVHEVDAVSDRLTTAINDRRTLGAESDLTNEALAAVRERSRSLQMRVTELESLLPALEDAEEAELAAARARTEAQAAIDSKASLLAIRRKDLEVRLAGLRERDQFLRQRLTDAEHRLEADSEARRDAGARRERIELALAAVERLATVVAAHRSALDARHGHLQEQRHRQSDEVRAVATRLDAARRARQEAERELEVVREKSRRVEVEEAEMRMRLEGTVEMIRRDLEVEPDVAEAAPMPEVPEGVTHADRARVLERDIRLMGPINPLALQEFTELQERHRFLDEQLTDVRNSRRELSQVIAAIDVEIQTIFADAFKDVAKNFTELFSLLFPGGKGRLVLTNPDDLLNTGIEVEATPPGKTFKKLSLLSGGERSLTAVAYLFAVFRSRPSPFYVMDEVEAALDDVNLHRFLGLVDEFRRDAQLIIVSHQKRTMEAADTLIGVTMQPGGSSKIVTERPSDSLAG